jgi:hypothetical protein
MRCTNGANVGISTQAIRLSTAALSPDKQEDTLMSRRINLLSFCFILAVF